MQDLRHLNWDTKSGSASKCSGGSYYKSYDSGVYYKLSAGDALTGIYGHESVNECLISDILMYLGIPHLTYTGERSLINLKGREMQAFVCSSQDFKREDEDKLALDFYYELYADYNTDIVDFCKEIDIFSDIEYMLLCDYLFINRDRHGANIELLKCGDNVRIAPLFDNGLSLVATLQSNTDAISVFDAVQDRVANNFIGSKSLEENLSLIENPITVNALSESMLRGFICRYAMELSPVHINKIHEIIWKRYCYARDKGVLRER